MNPARLKIAASGMLAEILAFFCGYGIATAQVDYSSALSFPGATLIYSNAFNGAAVTVNGTAPTVANSVLGGTNTATWNVVSNNVGNSAYLFQDGTVGLSGNSYLLPFTPRSNYVYVLTVSANLPAMTSGKWVNWGFAQFATNKSTGARFADSAVNGYDFTIGTCVAGSEQYWAGPRASGYGISSQLMPTAGNHALQIILDTTLTNYLGTTNWVGASFVDGKQLGTNWVFTGAVPIGAVGLGQTTLTSSAGIQYVYLTLSGTPIVIGTQPISAGVSVGSAFTNTVVVAATKPAFQWYRDGVAIDQATNASLVLDPVALGDASTNYYVVITNTLGALTSAVASLTVSTNIIDNTNSPIQLTSPDGSLALTFVLSNFDGSLNCPVYSLTRNGQPLITTSKLGLTFGSGGLLRENLMLSSSTNSANDSIWQPVYAEKSQIRDNYNQLVVNLQEMSSPNRLLQLTFRAYNEGLAFCYTIPAQAGFADATNLTEQTEFRFAADYAAWATYTAQGVYSQTTLSGINNGCERPLPVQLATNLYVALGEAALVDHSRMKFGPLAGKRYSLVSVLDGPVTNSLPLTTPWRFVMAADSPGQLLENNFFVLNLNAPCALTNTSWIKPGKVIRETTLKTVSGIACVDFAAKHNLSYIEFDAGWYGPESSTLTATNVSGSGLDLPAVINYAASNNIGVILYVNWLAMTNELNLLPSLYHSWGVKGIKYGFVSVGPQQYTEIVNRAARICATNQMMLEVHDEFRPSGYTRTYPNFMTVEGISGDETTPTAAQDITLLFSRMLVGGADHTVCYFDPRVTNNWSCAYQLAKAVCFYSPWEYLYWYDRPTNSSGYVSGGNDMITEVPEMEFYDYLPTVWDETRVLQGSIGQYAIIARRAGVQWFIGAMNANSTRTFSLPLGFLTPGQQYVENIYSQDPSVPTRTHVRIDRSVVNSTATLTMTLDASRGQAIRLLPAIPPEIQSVSKTGNGGFGLTITGMVSQPYSLWTTPDFPLSAINWTLVSSGLITNSPFTFSSTLSQTQRFYRCSTP